MLNCWPFILWLPTQSCSIANAYYDSIASKISRTNARCIVHIKALLRGCITMLDIRIHNN